MDETGGRGKNSGSILRGIYHFVRDNNWLSKPALFGSCNVGRIPVRCLWSSLISFFLYAIIRGGDSNDRLNATAQKAAKTKGAPFGQAIVATQVAARKGDGLGSNN